MGSLSKSGRICYGIAIAGIGAQCVYYRAFPYIVPLPKYPWAAGIEILAFIAGVLLILAGAAIVFEKMARQIPLLTGSVLLLIFCLYYIPYQLMAGTNYMHFGDWENAAKELAFAGGAFVIAGCFPVKNEKPLPRFLGRLIPFGAIIFAVTIFSFGIDHFLYAKDAARYIPSWIPYHMFWMYFAGMALLGSAIAIILKIRTRLIATLLGAMIFTWFVSLHIPKVIMASAADRADEVTSAFFALAYSGIAFVIAGSTKKTV